LANLVRLGQALEIALKPLKATPKQLSSFGVTIRQIPFPRIF